MASNGTIEDCVDGPVQSPESAEASPLSKHDDKFKTDDTSPESESSTTNGIIQNPLNGDTTETTKNSNGMMAKKEEPNGTMSNVSSPTEGEDEDTNDVDAKGFNLPGYVDHLPRKKTNDSEIFYTTTEKDSADYDLSEGLKLVIVLNQENFKKEDLTRRNGTESDCQAIKETFEKVGFRVDIYDDLSVERIRQVIRKLQTERVQMACLFMFILTHGEENGVLHAHDMMYRLDRDIVNQLTPDFCQSLAGKPKVIFVQACSGKIVDKGYTVTSRPRSRHTSTDGAGNNFQIPHFADFMIFQASYWGHYSFRSSAGSWLVQSFCKCLRESDDETSLHEVMIKTKRIVALDKVSNIASNPELHLKKQIPLVQDTLIRNLYLKKSELNGMEGTPSMTDGNTSLSNDTRRQNEKKESKADTNGLKNGGHSKKDKCKLM